MAIVLILDTCGGRVVLSPPAALCRLSCPQRNSFCSGKSALVCFYPILLRRATKLAILLLTICQSLWPWKDGIAFVRDAFSREIHKML